MPVRFTVHSSTVSVYTFVHLHFIVNLYGVQYRKKVIFKRIGKAHYAVLACVMCFFVVFLKNINVKY